MSEVVDRAWDLLQERPPSAERTALEALLGRSAFRVADAAGLADITGEGMDAARGIQVFVAKALLYALDMKVRL